MGAALLSRATAIGIAVGLGFGSVEALELRGTHHVGLRLDARTGAVLTVERAAETNARRDQRGDADERNLGPIRPRIRSDAAMR